VVSNPPYMKAGAGRLSPDRGRAIARHELAMTLDGLVRAASRLLRPGGSLTIIMLYGRLGEYRVCLGENGFGQVRFREVRPAQGAAPRLFMSEARLDAEDAARTAAPLVLTDGAGARSDEVKKILRRYAE